MTATIPFVIYTYNHLSTTDTFWVDFSVASFQWVVAKYELRGLVELRSTICCSYRSAVSIRLDGPLEQCWNTFVRKQHLLELLMVKSASSSN